MIKKYLTDLTLIGVAVIWALNFSVVKISLLEFDPFSFNAIRFFLAFLLLYFAAKKKGLSLKVKREHFWALVGIGLIGNLLYQMLFIVGINLTKAANASVMLGTIPIWVALLSQFFTEEKLTPLKTIGVLFAFFGVALIVAGGNNEISFKSDTFLGDIITILSAVVWAVYTIFSKKYLKFYNSTQFSAFMALIGFICLAIIGAPSLVELEWSSISPKAYGGLFYSGTLSVGIAYLIWNNGIVKIGAVRTATYQNLVPVLGLIFGVIILDEVLTLFQYIGALSVIAGIVMARLPVKKIT
ncbi:MAG TPA: EamA/RhaT family transporter [Balneola sp.]|nr:EamA family transporter [Balneola sp.]MAO77987.1 EamA family transporter [Balneola sp.]MBF65222.1 EamA family transporter [Balneola sp.]HAH52748.1 EamA/RhaT family transporter [Balneola sp.]HBZ37531.1 EamA/RhaT family transporter [Balneola sp.]